MLKIIISPAKKMNVIEDSPCELTSPAFLDRALKLHAALREMDLPALKNLWKCSPRLAAQNWERLHTYSPEQALTPALLAYEGLQYQHMAPGIFTDTQWAYAVSHLRILSGFYGILHPTDKVIPYRLEMQAKLKTAKGPDLYSWWGDSLYRELLREGTTELVNLASADYSRAVLPYMAPHSAGGPDGHDSSFFPISCVTCIFGELSGGRVKMKGTQAKAARGEMVRWMAESEIKHTADIRYFHGLGYKFLEKLSTEETYVFAKTS